MRISDLLGARNSFRRIVDNGPPLRNKPLDWRRPIDIAVCEPRVLAPELLADQRATREYLWKACLDARRHLGIETPAEERMGDEGGEEQG